MDRPNLTLLPLCAPYLCVRVIFFTMCSFLQDPGRLQLMKYSEKLQRSTTKIGAKFVDYVPESGSWVFEVEHFTKYRLVDDDSEEEEEQKGQTKAGPATKVRVYTPMCVEELLGGSPVRTTLHTPHTAALHTVRACTYV